MKIRLVRVGACRGQDPRRHPLRVARLLILGQALESIHDVTNHHRPSQLYPLASPSIPRIPRRIWQTGIAYVVVTAGWTGCR